MPDSLNYLAPSLYADDTVIYGSSNHCDDLVDKVNSDLYNIDNWMIQNRLQTHSKKSKNMFIIDHPITLKIKFLKNLLKLIINSSLGLITTCAYIGVKWNKKLSWEENINNTCLKVNAGIGATIRIYTFVPLSTVKML